MQWLVNDLLIASNTGIERFIQPVTEFYYNLDDLVKGRAGSVFYSAQDELAIGIGFLTVITVDIQFLSVTKGSRTILVKESVGFYFL